MSADGDTLWAVHLPPEDSSGVSSRAVNLLISFERVVLARQDFQQVNMDDVRYGIAPLTIETPPKHGALHMLERLALSDRVVPWIVSERFSDYGKRFAGEVEDWLRRNNLSEKVLARIGFTNFFLSHSFVLDPHSAAPPPGGFVESDVWTAIQECTREGVWREDSG